MRKDPNNIFTWATSELSQDAFICWLLAWAKPDAKLVDETMHQAGIEFLKAILAKHEVKITDIRTVKVITQKFHIDVLAIINEKYVIIIEDKVHASTHGNQLTDYINAIKQDETFKNYIVLPTFVKTGDQSRYYKEEKEGYKLFLRDDFLSVLTMARNNRVKNNILIDFLKSIEDLHANVQSFLTTTNEEWSPNAWIGFYEYLQNKIQNVKWKYVPNQSGGFFGAWWHFIEWKNCDVYLQIEQGSLCFKISVEDRINQSKLRNEWHKKILNSAIKIGLKNVERPSRFGKGECMTVAIIGIENWIMTKDNSCIDLNATLQILEKSAECINFAVSSDK